MPDRVELFEVGPRDGLQNEPDHIPTAAKIDLIDRLSRVGFGRIEVASFVSPRWVPQMADAADVLAGLTRRDGVSFTALTPNLVGYDRAIAAGADEIAVFASASEGFSQSNINCSISESLGRFAPLVARARVDKVQVRAYVSCVVECPFDGPVAPDAVLSVASALRDIGCHELSLGDTLGRADQDQVSALLDTVCGKLPARILAGHFHDTFGQAIANIETSLDYGLRVFDGAVSGLGGCPYAPGAPGNVATEMVNARLVALGYDTGLNSVALNDAAKFAKTLRTKRSR